VFCYFKKTISGLERTELRWSNFCVLK